MNDKQIRETLGRINKVFPTWYRYYKDADTFPPKGLSENIHRRANKTLRTKIILLLNALAERQAGMEEITRLKRQYAVGQTTGERAREIARRFTGGE